MTPPVLDRSANAWRGLEREQRLAALTSLGLFFSMLLPWYGKTNTFVEHGVAKATQTSSNAFQAFSFVEAAVLLVSAGVLTMLFARVEGRDFHLPGGDGTIVMIAGGWSAVLIFYRLLDKPGLQSNQRITATEGVEWGIFIALLLALGLLYAGARMRTAEGPGPPLTRPRSRPRAGDPDGGGPSRETPAEDGLTAVLPSATGSRSSVPAPATAPSPAPAERRPARGRPRYPPAPAEQMSLEDPPHEGD